MSTYTYIPVYYCRLVLDFILRIFLSDWNRSHTMQIRDILRGLFSCNWYPGFRGFRERPCSHSKSNAMLELSVLNKKNCCRSHSRVYVSDINKHKAVCATVGKSKCETCIVWYNASLCSILLQLCIFALPSSSLLAGPRLNIKTVLSTYGDFHVKDKTAVRTSYL